MQRYFALKKEEKTFILRDDDLYHIRTVMRMKEKDKMEVVFNSIVYICCIENNTIKILEQRQIKKIKEKEIVLVIPLLKEAKMDLILQKATELGVSKIIPLVMERSIVKLDVLKEDKRITRWNRICKEASEQSMRLDIPIITEIKKIGDLKNEKGVKLVCSTIEKENKLHSFLQNSSNYDRIIIVIGPEGGITLKEEKLLNEMGFISVSLGNRVMRVETVPLFILSVLNYEYME